MDINCIKCFENCFLCVLSEECLECKNNFYYGKICNLMCNIVCINKICDIMGSCRYGCDNSKYGKECDKDCMKYCKICFNLIMCLECEVGYFGKLCIMCLKIFDGRFYSVLYNFCYIFFCIYCCYSCVYSFLLYYMFYLYRLCYMLSCKFCYSKSCFYILGIFYLICIKSNF